MDASARLVSSDILRAGTVSLENTQLYVGNIQHFDALILTLHKRVLCRSSMAVQASLYAFKRAFISKDVLSVIVGMLEEPLSHVGVIRTEVDNFSIELCLTLLRNILNIKDPTPGMVTSLGDHYVQMHEQLVELMQDALLLDILLLLAQDVHARENAKLNLLLVEIFHCVIRDQEPGAVIAVHRAKGQRDATGKGSNAKPSSAPKPKASLLGVLAKERAMRGNVSGQMHRCVLDVAGISFCTKPRRVQTVSLECRVSNEDKANCSPHRLVSLYRSIVTFWSSSHSQLPFLSSLAADTPDLEAP